MNNLKTFASSEAIQHEALRTFVDWVIYWTTRGSNNPVVITYTKKNWASQKEINEAHTQLEELERNLQNAIDTEEPSSTIYSIRNQIKQQEKWIDNLSKPYKFQPAKVVVNREDLPRFLRYIDESWKVEVYEALKATGLRLNEFINPTEEPSCQGILELDLETWAWLQRWTREYTWSKKEEDE